MTRDRRVRRGGWNTAGETYSSDKDTKRKGDKRKDKGQVYESRRKEGGKNEEPRQDSETQRLIGDKLMDIDKESSVLFTSLRSGTV